MSDVLYWTTVLLWVAVGIVDVVLLVLVNKT